MNQPNLGLSTNQAELSASNVMPVTNTHTASLIHPSTLTPGTMISTATPVQHFASNPVRQVSSQATNQLNSTTIHSLPRTMDQQRFPSNIVSKTQTVFQSQLTGGIQSINSSLTGNPNSTSMKTTDPNPTLLSRPIGLISSASQDFQTMQPRFPNATLSHQIRARPMSPNS